MEEQALENWRGVRIQGVAMCKLISGQYTCLSKSDHHCLESPRVIDCNWAGDQCPSKDIRLT